MKSNNKLNAIFVVLIMLNVLLTIRITQTNAADETSSLFNFEFSTFLGGNGEDGTGEVELDAARNIIVATKTDSTNFPMVNAYQPVNNGSDDGIIFKLSNDGQEILFSTYFGGANDDYIYALALDSEDNIIIAGTTASSDFPVKNALNTTKSTSPRDVFLAKFSSDGQELLFSTFICGTSNWHADIGIDSSDNIYLVGSTDTETLLATVNTYQPIKKNSTDAFITKISSDGQTVYFSTYFGGNDFENIRSMTLDSGNNVIICGYTSSADLPLEKQIQNRSISTFDNYISKISSDGKDLLFSSYFGGNRQWGLVNLIADKNDNILFIGETNSVSFPLVNASQTTYGGGETDGFVSKIKGEDYTLQFATYLGGSSYDGAHGVLIDNNDDLIITGTTASINFPTLNPYQTFKGNVDVFIVKMTDEGQIHQFASFLGEYGSDYSWGITLDSETNSIIMNGHTNSQNFPLVNPIQDQYKGGDFDTFICKFSLESTTSAAINIGYIFSSLFLIMSIVIIYSQQKKKSKN